jgi:F-actin capping protein, beta subunit.
MENKTKVTAAVNLLKRLDPSNSRQHIQEIIAFKPEIRGELLKKVDTPLGKNLSVLLDCRAYIGH